MHGGQIFLRCDAPPADLPGQVTASKASEEDMQTIEAYIDEFCRAFGRKKVQIMNKDFYTLRPDSKNPYTQLYTQN